MAEALAHNQTAAEPFRGVSGTVASVEAEPPKRVQAPPPKMPPWTGVTGFVDIHCHLLPGLDDGPANHDAALALAISAYGGGTAAIVATPHCSFRFPFDADRSESELKRLDGFIPEDLAIFGGCELEISDESLREFFAHPRRFTLNGGRYVLIEMMGQSCPPNFDQVLLRFRERGFRPILAHPERCPAVRTQRRLLRGWRDHGCLFQVTAGSLTGRMGRGAQAAAAAVLREGLADFVASDAHDAAKRPPDLLESFRIASEIVGIAWAGRLFTYHSLAVLHDEALS